MAVINYVNVSSASPECEEILVELGLMYLRLGDTKRAFQQFGTALAQKPNYAKAILPMAYILQVNNVIKLKIMSINEL